MKYRLLDMFARVGHLLPMWILQRVYDAMPSEPQLIVALAESTITIDQFDFRVDAHCTVARCMDRKGRA